MGRKRVGPFVKSVGGVPVAADVKPVAVLHGTRVIGRYATIAEGEAVIDGLSAVDPDGVFKGDYSIDAPETLVNPPKHKPVATPRLSVSQLGTLQTLLIAYERECREGTFYVTADEAKSVAECVSQDILERTIDR